MVRKLLTLITCLTLTVLAIAQSHLFYGVNIFDKLFTEPIEIMYFVMSDGALFKLTSYSEVHIFGNLDDLEKHFDKCGGYKVEDIAICIHNHIYPSSRFSETDIDFLIDLKDRGFKGSFLLRTPTGKIIKYKGK